MAKWLDRLRRPAPVEGVPREWLAALGTLLDHVAATPGGTVDLATNLRDVVLGTLPEDALARLAAHPAVRKALTADLQDPPPVNEARVVLAGEIAEVRPDVALRWLQLRTTGVSLFQGTSGSLKLPGDATWPYLLLGRTQFFGFAVYRTSTGTLSLDVLERLEAAAGWRPGTVLTAVLAARDLGWIENALVTEVLESPQLAAALVRHGDAVRGACRPPFGVEGLNLADALSRTLDTGTAASWAAHIAALLTSSAKRTRSAAHPLARLVETVPEVRAAVVAVSRDGSPPERVPALSVLYEAAQGRGDSALLEAIRSQAEQDAAVSVRRLAAAWEAAGSLDPAQSESSGAAAPHGTEVALPEVVEPSVDWRVPVTPQVEAAVDAVWRSVETQIRRWNDQVANAPRTQKWQKTQRPLDEAARRDLLALLASDRVRARASSGWPAQGVNLLGEAVQFGATAGCRAGLKFAALFHTQGDLLWFASAVVRATAADVDLLTVAALLEPFGGGPQAVLRLYCSRWSAVGSALPDDAVWPFFTRHVALVEEAVGTPSDYDEDRSRLYRGIAAMPVLPPSLVRRLTATALTGPKAERLDAQRALTRLPGVTASILVGLGDGKAETRAVAARWLGDRGDTSVIPLLEKAYAKEKHDVAKAAMLDALEALGRPAAEYLDLADLAKEPAAVAAKPVPAAVSWLSWDALPPVRWAEGVQDAGRPVPPDVLRRILVQSVKARAPEPNALLRRYASLWDHGDRVRLAAHLLSAWLSHDIAPIALEEARRRADDQAQMWHGWLTTGHLRLEEHPWRGWSKDQIAAALLPAQARTPAGSAIDSKGLLAVVAACAGPDVVTPVERYVKDWYGHRTAQCKALMGMLAWVDHPAAIALLLSIGSRFRTKSVQDEATAQVEALAERKGWTVDELADRTIPGAGFDVDGVLTLDYGPRQFDVVLRPDFTVWLRAADGKELKALPSPRVDEDAELAAAAKKTLSATKRELSSTVAQQTVRLYEAMCTGRTWPFEDWDRYLNRHPIVRHLVQRLVWAEVAVPGDDENGEQEAAVKGRPPVVRQTFRPLDDGTLTDVDDKPWTPLADARVCLAHDAFLDEGTVAAWTAHLADYEVTPPFSQLGAGFWRLPPERASRPALEDFEGHVLEAFALRGRAGKRGWLRGQAEDGGVFVTYSKRFPSLHLEAVLEFTGNGLPEENRRVALLGLKFQRIVDGGSPWNAPAVPLGEVPPVLLSECRHDVALMAADGSGYDPDWQKVTPW